MAITKNEKTGRYRIDFRDQHKVRSRRYYDTKKAATIALANITGKVSTGEFISPKAIPTFKAAGALWLESKGKRRPGTLANWRAHLAQHLYPAIGHLRLDYITVERIERLRTELQQGEAAVSAGTAKNIITTCGAVLKAAVRHGTLTSNPVQKIERAYVEAKELTGDDDDDSGKPDPQTVLNPAEIDALLAEADPGYYRTLFETAFLTGARSGELLALRWSDVELPDTGRGKLRVGRGLTWARERNEPTAARFFPPKTKAGLRTIPISTRLVSTLKVWKLRCPVGAADLVFPAPDGRPNHRATVTRRGLRPALDRAKLRHVTFHSLRHSFASALLAGGAPITEVQHLLGHANPAITLRVYSHWFKDVETDSIDKLADALAPNTGKGGGKGGLANFGHDLGTPAPRRADGIV